MLDGGIDTETVVGAKISYRPGTTWVIDNIANNAGHHEGSDSFSLVAGNDYSIRTLFRPSVVGGVGWLQGELDGNISFDFNGAPVPEPATMFLLGSGLVGLAGFRRKLRK